MSSDKSVINDSKPKFESKKASDDLNPCEFEPILSDVELVWRGKRQPEKNEVSDLLPVERVRIPSGLSTESYRSSHSNSFWTNKIIRGDNQLVMNCLMSGELKDQIHAVGGVKLVYIDPPFLVGTDYNMSILVGDDRSEKLNVIQEHAYSDSWEKGSSSYLNMMYQRLKIIRRLLADDGSLWVHCDWKANFMIRAILDEVFGAQAFRNEIIWYYTNKIPDTRKRQYTNATDTIFYYAKSSKSIFNWQFEKRDKPIKVSVMRKVDGKKVYPRGDDGKCIYVTRKDRTADNVWKIPLLHAHPEMWGYPTQKPVRLLERVIMTATNEGDLVADFFCGSGTVLEAAQRLGRKWIGCDIGKIATHTCRKRIIHLISQDDDIKRSGLSFDVLEASIPPNKSDSIPFDSGVSDVNADGFVQTTIFDFDDRVESHKAQRLDLGKMVGISSDGSSGVFFTDRHIRIHSLMIQEILDMCSNRGIKNIEIVGFEYDNSVNPSILEEAEKLSIGICLKKATKEFRSKSEVGSDGHEAEILAFFKVIMNLEEFSAKVTLSDFGLYCLGMNQEVSIENGKMKSSRILVDRMGKLVRSTIKRNANKQRHILTKTWSDWIDYWAVDFNYGGVKQLSSSSGDNLGSPEDKPVFTSVWHSFRTPKKRSIELSTPFWKYDSPGDRKIAVQVVDVFGNETIRVIEALNSRKACWTVCS
ncbi:MAG: DNA methyltransferase [Pseudomonadota bacterium]